MLEMLIAMTILAVGLLGVAALQIVAIQGSGYSIKYNQATVHVSDAFEQLKNTPYKSLPTGSHTQSIGEYAVTTTVSDGPTATTKSILIEATWQDKTGGKTHRTSYQTVIGPSQIGSTTSG